MVKVKVCGITNLSDALAAIAAGADALGFNFYERSPRYIAPAQVRAILANLPAHILAVGVFVNHNTPDDVARTAGDAGLRAVQLHGDETPEYCDVLRNFYLIKALRVGRGYHPSDAARYKVDAVLLDAHAGDVRGGSGHVFDWKIAVETKLHAPKIFLAGGLTSGNVAAAIAGVGPYAVDVCSGVESRPGVKDELRLQQFFAAVRQQSAASS